MASVVATAPDRGRGQAGAVVGLLAGLRRAGGRGAETARLLAAAGVIDTLQVLVVTEVRPLSAAPMTDSSAAQNAVGTGLLLVVLGLFVACLRPTRRAHAQD